MLFNSPEFIFGFLPITLLGFFWIGRTGHVRLAVAWLVAASLFYYAWWNPPYLALLLASVCVNFLLGGRVSRFRRRNRDRAASITVIMGIVFNLGLLGYYKYAGFFVSMVNDASDLNWTIAYILLPIGISFFTFQQIAYLVDCRLGVTGEHKFLDYSLFVTFFPQLIAGPIVHHKEVLPQFRRETTFLLSARNLSIGLTIFFIGLFKKVVIADNVALYTSPVFEAAEAGQSLDTFNSLRGIFGYTFQLYFDFSGYSDMAVGLGRMFGIRLPVNFESPYKAASIVDFWRRWHMTLSRFLRDYLYVPLGGNRKGRPRRHVNLMATMLLGGLWHGADWTFVAWGGLHGLFLMINHAWRRIAHGGERGYRRSTWARPVTFLCVAAAWVFFRAESFQAAVNVFAGLGNLPKNFQGRLGPAEGVAGELGVTFAGPWLGVKDAASLLVGAALLLWVWFAPNTQQLLARQAPALYPVGAQGREAALPGSPGSVAWTPGIVWAGITALLASLSLLSLTRVSEFIYYQF